MSEFPKEFQFTQHNLQDYVDCPRRFELRYLLQIKWPALQSEPVLEAEQRAELGRRFHEMVYQANLGVSDQQILEQVNDPLLSEWWAEYQSASLLKQLPSSRKAEFLLTAPFAGFRLAARYDLLAIDPQRRAAIIDWKTSRKPQKKSYLQARLQTRVYSFLLAYAGHTITGGTPFLPENIELIYWFTSQPQQPVQFPYSSTAAAADEKYLRELITEISTTPVGHFQTTVDGEKCLFCIYRSLCARGTNAGDLDEMIDDDLDPDLEIPFDQIGEIAF